MRIAILDWPNAVAYGSFTEFHRSIAVALTTLGHQAALFHDATSLEQAGGAGRWDCSVAIGSRYGCFDADVPVYERLNLPHFQWIVDNPYKASLPSWGHPLLRSIVIDQEFIGFGPVAHDGTLFLPLGTDLKADCGASCRDLDIVFTGQVKDPDEAWLELRQLPSAVVSAALPWMERVLAAADCSLLRSFEAEFPKEALAPELRAALFLRVNSFVRSWKRQQVLLSVRRLPVHVFGSVRSPRVLAIADFRFHGPIPYRELDSVLCRSRIALNVTPNFHAGCHDRIITSLACGALAATDTNPYLERHFVDGVDLLAYRYESLDRLETHLTQALADGSWERLARSGRQVVERSFTWMRVAGRFVDAVHAALPALRLSTPQAS